VVLRLDAKSPMIDDDLDDSAAAVLGLELLNRTERVEGMPPQPMAKRRRRSSQATISTQRRCTETARAAAS